MKISICLSTYNGGFYLTQFIHSLLTQTFLDWQLIVRDDGSSDETINLLHDFQSHHPDKIIFLENNEGNLGSRKSFMALIEVVQTPYIMLADQDDVWLPDKIKKSILKMQEMETVYGHQTPILVFSDMCVVDNNLNVLHESFWSYQKLDPGITTDWKKLLAQNVITGCTIIMNQAAKEVSLPFKVDTMMHDHWIGVNVAKYGKIGYVNEPTVLYRQHEANVEGAHHYGWQYVLQKIKNLKTPLYKLYHSAYHFRVPFIHLLIDKIIINLKRLLGKR